jgi:hypothetical protein
LPSPPLARLRSRSACHALVKRNSWSSRSSHGCSCRLSRSFCCQFVSVGCHS